MRKTLVKKKKEDQDFPEDWRGRDLAANSAMRLLNGSNGSESNQKKGPRRGLLSPTGKYGWL